MGLSLEILKVLAVNPDKEFTTSELYYLGDKKVSIGPALRCLYRNNFVSKRLEIKEEKLLKHFKITDVGLNELKDNSPDRVWHKRLEEKKKYFLQRAEYYKRKAEQIQI
jgi:hypothetical protein